MTGSLLTITLRFAVSPHPIMSLHTDGSAVLWWSLVLMKDVLDVHPSPHMSGPSTLWEDLDAPCNVFQLKAHCTNRPFAIQIAS